MLLLCRFTCYCKKLDDDVSHRLIKYLDKLEAERVAAMLKAESLILQSKAFVIAAAKNELSSGFKPIGLVFGGLVGIDAHMSSRRLGKKVTDVHGIVTRLSDKVTDEHSSLGDEIAKLTVEVSKLSTLISKDTPNLEVERKMDAVLAATEILVSEYVKKSGQKKKYGGLQKKYGGLQKTMHGFVTWLFDVDD